MGPKKPDGMQVPVSQKMPRFVVTTTKQNEVWKDYCRKENGEDRCGYAIRDGTQKGIDYGEKIRTRGHRIPSVDMDQVNGRHFAGDSQTVFAIAKRRNEGHGDIIGHHQQTGECDVLG
ncbi:hypothetical protein CYMTET_7036 [Cymbomonas tetramitiformis]|uniref:Uncharacterized protein n=1 Tax=Cymbomonas tetramitiformis TaxID=36881 RepID=A0AAE0GXQ7_9CHLO|nr:hypothetical protein CYMTET_7036 [Cymbomonas tetramitiformis]